METKGKLLSISSTRDACNARFWINICSKWFVPTMFQVNIRLCTLRGDLPSDLPISQRLASLVRLRRKSVAIFISQ